MLGSLQYVIAQGLELPLLYICLFKSFKRFTWPSLHAVSTALGNNELPPYLRHCYQLILKGTSEGWDKAMKKWPQPANMWTGSLEVGHGTLLTSAGRTIPVQYTMWRDDPASLRDKASWGGMFHTAIGLEFFYEEQLYLQIEDGKRGEILLKKVDGPGDASVFDGKGVFPH